jgi:hypothetical protein
MAYALLHAGFLCYYYLHDCKYVVLRVLLRGLRGGGTRPSLSIAIRVRRGAGRSHTGSYVVFRTVRCLSSVCRILMLGASLRILGIVPLTLCVT